jgi:hypothetical protein
MKTFTPLWKNERLHETCFMKTFTPLWKNERLHETCFMKTLTPHKSERFFTRARFFWRGRFLTRFGKCGGGHGRVFYMKSGVRSSIARKGYLCTYPSCDFIGKDMRGLNVHIIKYHCKTKSLIGSKRAREETDAQEEDWCPDDDASSEERQFLSGEPVGSDHEEDGRLEINLDPLLNINTPMCSDDSEGEHSENDNSQGPRAPLTTTQLGLLDFAATIMRYGVSSQAMQEIIRWMKQAESTTIEKIPSKPRNFWTKFDRIFYKRKKVVDNVQVSNFVTELDDHVNFYYVEPRKAITRLLSNKAITNEATLLWEFDPEAYSGSYAEVNSGEWWKRTEIQVRREHGRHVHLLPLILCADGSPTSLKGSVKPAYLSLGNLRLKARLRIDSKECLAYIPDKGFAEDEDDNLSERRRLINFRCWDVLLKKLDMDKLLEWEFEGRKIHFALRVMFFLGDHPESQALAGVKGSWNTSHPCRHCLVPASRMAFLSETYPPRTESRRDDIVRKFRESGRTRKNDKESLLSFHVDISSASRELTCFKGRYFKSFPMCIGHVFFSQGLIKRCLGFLLVAISEYGFKVSKGVRELMTSDELMGSIAKKASVSGKARLRELDRRIGSMPHFSTRRPDGSMVYLTTFRRGIGKLSFLTGTHYLHLLQIVPVCIGNSGSFFMPEDCRIHMLKLFSALHSIVYLVKGTKVWTEETISQYQELIEELSKLLTDRSFVSISPSEMQFSKLHALSHVVDMVREYGAPCNIDTSLYDHAHKDSVKKAYKLSSKQEGSCIRQMLVNNERLKAISLLKSQTLQVACAPRIQDPHRPAFKCHVGSRAINPSCPGISLDHSALFGMRYFGPGRAGWLTVAMNRMEMDAEERKGWYQQMESRKFDLVFYDCAYIPSTKERLVCANRYGLKEKQRFDFVEIGGTEEHTYGEVRAIFSAFSQDFILVRSLFPAFEEFEHPQMRWGYVSYAEDRVNNDGVHWDCWKLEKVVRKVFAVADFDYEGRFFINTQAVL